MRIAPVKAKFGFFKTLTMSSTVTAIAVGAQTIAAGPALATVWTDWTSRTFGTPGSAAGTLSGIDVSYTGEVASPTIIGGFFSGWQPESSFVGGTVTTSPDVVRDAISLEGRYTGPNTVTFASPVVNPVMAFWSVGGHATPVTFTFLNATPTFEAGGPNGLGGSAINVSGNTVTGLEGNGVVQFTGTFSSISWTDTREFYYDFTIGAAGLGTPGPGPEPGTVPEPASLGLLASALAGFGLLRRRRK